MYICIYMKTYIVSYVFSKAQHIFTCIYIYIYISNMYIYIHICMCILSTNGQVCCSKPKTYLFTWSRLHSAGAR